MIEGIFAIFAAIIEAVVSIAAVFIEFVASLFLAAGETMSAAEAIGVVVAFVVEFIYWVILVVVELVLALFAWRKPRKVKKPKLSFFRKRKDKQEREEKSS